MTQSNAEVTLDALLRRNAACRADQDALADPPNRETVCGGEPCHLTYRQADQSVDALAGVLRQSGLPPGSVIGIQLPNVAESILAPLAVMRAGMVPALLPLLWRQSECIAALAHARAKALITCARVGAFDHGQFALEIAAELFPIRIVFGFGAGLSDGIVRLDDMWSRARQAPAWSEADCAVAAPCAAVTFDVGQDGPVPIPRTCGQLLAGGLLIRDRGRIAEHSVFVSTIPIASCAGLSTVLLPWLLSGGALALHHPFEPEILCAQIARHRPQVLIAPDTVAPALCDAGLCEGGAPETIVSIGRAPHRMHSVPAWPKQEVRLVDVAAFGELALLAQTRPQGGQPVGWREGPVLVHEGAGEIEIARVAATPHGTLGIRGALAASVQPAGGADEVVTAHVQATDDGFIDTRHGCAPASDRAFLVATAPPPALAQVGGYRFAVNELQQAVRRHDRDALIAALPHALCGQRLAGHCAAPSDMRDSLRAQGFNPLVAQAFSARNATAR